jgi:hypothetical protein
LGFLSAGKTKARFCEAGMQPSESDLLKRYRKKGAISSRISVIIKGGRL